MTKSPKRTLGGFTIVEVAVAAAILAIGFAGMLQALAIGTEMLDTARKQTIAAQIIQSEVERLRMLTWTGVMVPPDLYATNQPVAFSVNSTLARVAPDSSFRCSRAVSLANSRPDLRQVTITVSWTGVTGRNHSRSTNVYLGKNGLNVAYQKM